MHFESIGDPTYIQAAYMNGIIFAIETEGKGGFAHGAGSYDVQNYPANRLIVGTQTSEWNVKLVKELEKMKIPTGGLFGSTGATP